MQVVQYEATAQAAVMAYVLAVYTSAFFDKAPKPFSCRFCMMFWWGVIIGTTILSLGVSVNPLLAVFGAMLIDLGIEYFKFTLNAVFGVFNRR